MPLYRRRRALVVAGCTVTACAIIVPAGAPAGADPVSDAKRQAAAAAASAAAARARVGQERTQIAAVQRQLDALDVQAEIAAEAYNAAVEQLRWADRVAGAAQQRLAAATAALAGLRTRAGAVAVQAYQRSGWADLALLTDAAGPATLLDREAMLQAVADVHQNSLQQLEIGRHEQAFAKVAADTALARQRQLTADKRRQRDAVLATAARQQQLLGRLQEAQARLVAQAQAAMARATTAKRSVDAAMAARALEIAQARAAALARQRTAHQAAERSFRAATSARRTSDATSSRRGETGRGSAGTTTLRAGTVESSVSGPPSRGSGGAAVAVRWAKRQIGKPYVWAADGPEAYDCSGLTQYVWAKAGVYLPHYSGGQIGQGAQVSSSELIPGDLVFFGSPIHHVGIYVGDGRMINAPHTGALVREEPVWWPQYAGAVRPSG